MLDKVDIQETISRYHEGASLYEWDQIVATFLPDGVWEVPEMGIRCQGHAEIRTKMPSLVEPIEYLVQINAPAIIDLDGERATARTLIRECAQFRDGGLRMDVVGQFKDELQRTPDGWKFAHRTFTIIGTHVTEGGR
jgi:hypothetical protein